MGPGVAAGEGWVKEEVGVWRYRAMVEAQIDRAH
jgi:hypothetical protein